MLLQFVVKFGSISERIVKIRNSYYNYLQEADDLVIAETYRHWSQKSLP